MSWEDFKTLTTEEFSLSNELQKLETKLWNHAMVGASHATYTDRFHELARLFPYLVTLESKRIKRNGSIKKNPKKRGNMGEPSKDRNVRDDNKRTRTGNAFAITTNPVKRENMGHYAKDCRVALRIINMNPSMLETQLLQHVMSVVVPIISSRLVLGSWKPWESGKRLGIHIGSRGGSLRSKHHDGSGSFDVIIGMDWLSDHKAEIICHEKVVRIPLLDSKMLRVLGEKPKEKMRQLMSAQDKEKKQQEIVVVRDFPEVFPDDLSGLPLVREIKFRIELILGAMPVAKSLYRLAPSELEELSGQLKELQDKGFIRPSSSSWGALVLFVKKNDGSYRMCIVKKKDG
ncbi:hypothetical protein Tco_0516220 [Tanacetum coccineum]